MSATGAMAMPDDFRYKNVFLKGKPQHDRYDPFAAKHPKMDVGHRAKIFAPFDALRGFNFEIMAKDVLYEDMTELSDDDRAELDRRLRILNELTWSSYAARMNSVKVTVTHFVVCTDEHNDAYGVRGRYVETSGICRRVDAVISKAIRIDDEIIGFRNIRSIENADGIFDEGAG